MAAPDPEVKLPHAHKEKQQQKAYGSGQHEREIHWVCLTLTAAFRRTQVVQLRSLTPFANHPFGVKNIFESWLEQHFPEKKDKVLNKIRAIRGGKLNDPNFGSRMRGEGIFAEQINQMFHVACRKAGLKDEPRRLTTEHFRRPGGLQMELGI